MAFKQKDSVGTLNTGHLFPEINMFNGARPFSKLLLMLRLFCNILCDSTVIDCLSPYLRINTVINYCKYLLYLLPIIIGLSSIL